MPYEQNRTDQTEQIIHHRLYIYRLREQKHLQNTDMVAKLQLEGIPINTDTLSKIKRGACNPATAQMIALQKILGCDYSSFFNPC